MSASPPRVRRRWRHHGDRLAGLPTPFIQPGRSSFRPGARRRSLLFGCVVLVWPRAGGGQPPNIRRVRFALRFRAAYHFLLTNYPTFCQQFRALPSWLKRDGVFFVLRIMLKSDGDFLTLNFPQATLPIKNPRRAGHLGFLLTKGGVICQQHEGDPGFRPSCRKSGADTQNIPIRGR